jgi:hypothetical protein
MIDDGDDGDEKYINGNHGRGARTGDVGDDHALAAEHLVEK